MHGGNPTAKVLRGPFALALIALALLVRVLVPTGWMPATGGQAITLCTGAGAVTAWVDADGTVRQGKPVSAPASEQPCAFAGANLPADLPDLPPAPALPIAMGMAPVLPPMLLIGVGRGLAAPPPPPTGPPATA